MGFDNLEKFLQKKKEENAKTGNIDWQKEKTNWLLSIQELYETITKWLQPLVKRELLRFETEDIKMEEEYIGSYGTQILHVFFPDQEVVLKPIGRNIIGAAGRVDLIGRNGTVKLLLVDEQSNGPKITVSISTGNEMVTPKPEKVTSLKLAWKLSTPPPHVKFVELNEDSFSDALFEVIGEYE